MPSTLRRDRRRSITWRLTPPDRAPLLKVTINGTNTHWQQGVTTLTFPNVVINGTPTVVSPTQITANITVNTSAPAGEESVTATTLGEVATGVNVFDMIQTQPELLSVVASVAPPAGLSRAVQGWTGNVNLTGALHALHQQQHCQLRHGHHSQHGERIQRDLAASQHHRLADDPAGLAHRFRHSSADTEVVSITNAFQITVGPAAIVEALNPYNAPQNWTGNVIIVGSQTHWVQNVTTAYFGPYIHRQQRHRGRRTCTPRLPSRFTGRDPLTFYDVSLTTGGEVATVSAPSP